MPKTTYDIPNISAPKTREFLVDLVAPGINRPEEDKAAALARRFGGNESGSGFNFLTGTRDIGFTFRTYIEALAFVDAAEAIRSLKVNKIAYMKDQDDLYVQLYPKPKLLSWWVEPAKP